MELVNRIASAAVIGAAMLIGSSLSAPPAQAAYIVDLTQEGSNVVATGSGTLDVSDLTFVINESGSLWGRYTTVRRGYSHRAGECVSRRLHRRYRTSEFRERKRELS